MWYRKYSKKERVALLIIVSSVRKRLKMVTKIVFVNQMLLMRAGDVERNPGPGERDVYTHAGFYI